MQAFSLITQQFSRDTESFPAAIGVGATFTQGGSWNIH